MTAPPATDPVRRRIPGARRDEDILSRLRKATGQLAGTATMYQDGRYCIDILDQLAAVTAAVDAVALILLEDHMNSCVRDAVEHGHADDKVAELAHAVRRYVRSR
jgi:DNA-binding FrmR family transcriptional regulator